MRSLKITALVIIPAYNEERSLPSVLLQIHKIGSRFLPLVIDDGSTDKTALVAKKSGARVISLETNLGTGAATQKGLKYAVRNHYTQVVLLDADGQHDPKYIPTLFKKLRSADFVIGSRYCKPTQNSTSFIRRLGTQIISILIEIFYRQKIYDPTSGFRAINKKTLGYLTKHYPTTFSEPEILIDLIKHGFAIKEVSIEMKPRIYGRSSISLSRAIYLMSFIITKMVQDKLLIKPRDRINN